MVNISMESDEKKNLVKWLNALIAMAQWDTSLPFYFARLLNQPEGKEYSEALRLIRELPIRIPPPDRPGATLSEKEWQTLYEKTTSVATLRDLFADNNPFENAAPSQISVLAEISDLTTTTDPQTWFYSQNGAFHLVLAAVRLAAARQAQTGEDSEVNMKSLIGDAFGKFYIVFDTDPVLTEDLYKLACSNAWFPVLASLRDVADYTTEGSETHATLQAWNKRLIDPDLRTLVLKLFDVPRKLVKLAWERRDFFDEARNLIPHGLVEPHLLSRNERTDLREQVSNAAHKIFVEKAQTEVEEIESDLKLLEVIAKHYMSARKFVKLDGLVYLWPRIASLAMANYTSLQYVEDLLVNSKSTPSDSELELNDARELYELCANNRAVVRFLKLYPRFKEIDPNELRRYRRLARGVADPGAPSSSTMAQNVPNISPTPITSDLFPAAARVCELVIQNIPRPITPDPYQEQDFALSLRVTDQEIKKGTITFSTRKLLDRILAAMGVLSDDVLQGILKSLFSANTALEVLLRGGKELFSAIIIESGLEEQFTAVFEDDSPVRLVIVIPSIREELHFLPWEWLPRPGHKELLLSNSRYSIVRSKPVLSKIFVPISPPVRILGLFPNVPLGARDVSDSSLKELEQLGRTGLLFQSLVREGASVTRVKEEFEKFRPQIVHFEGHVTISGEENAAVRILFSNLTSTEPVGRPEFESLLQDHKVQLLVLGRNETNRVYGNAGPILASRVVRMAVPTVLAPIRAVDEVTATTFTTEFYRAFLRGLTVEQALFVARQKVESNGGDWTPFALFSDPWALDDFKPLPRTL